MFFIYPCGWSGTTSTSTLAIGLLYQPWVIHYDSCGAVSGMNEWQGKLKYWEKTCPSATLPTTDPT
jgi:hypothetical protein